MEADQCSLGRGTSTASRCMNSSGLDTTLSNPVPQAKAEFVQAASCNNP